MHQSDSKMNSTNTLIQCATISPTDTYQQKSTIFKANKTHIDSACFVPKTKKLVEKGGRGMEGGKGWGRGGERERGGRREEGGE